jgi:membrane protein implicated in regulation of membrane protease activity
MESFESLNILWFVIGTLLILAELYLGGIGIFLVGLGAITTGAFATWEIITLNDLVIQMITFFAATAIWTIILWKPFIGMKTNDNKQFSNMIGDEAIVQKDKLVRDVVGDVKWSGTILRAKLSHTSPVDYVDKGGVVKIVAIEKGIVIVDNNSAD